MKKAYKTELKPNAQQAAKIRRLIGICRFVYNKYIQMNLEHRAVCEKETTAIVKAERTSYWFITKEVFIQCQLPHLSDIHAFIASCPIVFIEAVLSNAEIAFQRYFQGKADLPRFKAKYADSVTLLYPGRLTAKWQIENDSVIVPGLGCLKLKEHGYLPLDTSIVRGSISYIAGRYFISATVQQDIEPINRDEYNGGMGIYIGANGFITLDDGSQIENIEKNRRVIVLKKKIAREIRSLSRRSHESNASNRRKQQEKLMKLRLHLEQVYSDYINKAVSEIVQRKPAYIVLGDIAVRKEAESSEAARKKLKECRLIELKNRLLTKCRQMGIAVRIPVNLEAECSTAFICSRCRNKVIQSPPNSDEDNTFSCTHCGLNINRSQNAAINLKNLQEYLTL